MCQEHGYLEGEQYTCPICGKKTEVYSRITGYYRPVQNWNDGKRAEFKERKVYDIAHSQYHGKQVEEFVCDDQARSDVKKMQKDEPQKECACCQKGDDEGLLIFTTKTCPNCKMAKAMLDKAGISYTVIDAEDNKDQTLAFGVKKAPTLLVPNGNGYDVYDNASKIKGYIESRK